MESFIFVAIVLIGVSALTSMSIWLSRKNPRLIFLAPGLLTAISLGFIFLTYTNESWVALGYFIFAFSGSIISLILWIITAVLFIKNR